MTLDTLIKQLQKLKEEHGGDTEVLAYDLVWDTLQYVYVDSGDDYWKSGNKNEKFIKIE